MMNIVLIEFNSHHDECLYSQVAFLKSIPNVKLYLVCNYRLKDRIGYLEAFNETLFVRSNQWGVGHLRILSFFKANTINKVIFNTIGNKSVANLLQICSKNKRDYFGVLHNLTQLKKPLFTFRYSKVTSLYVLNDYLLEATERYTPTHAKFESFYPIYFHKHNQVDVVKAKDEIWITIAGKMEKGRRDYLRLLESYKRERLKNTIKLIFLGRCDPDIRSEFESFNTNNNCVFWNGYVTNDVFHSYLQKTDYLLPLIHGNHDTAKAYRDKISGSFNLAFSYHIPMIMDSFFYEFEDFKTTALFYTPKDDLIQILNDVTRPVNKYTSNKWTFEFQRDRFISFLSRSF